VIVAEEATYSFADSGLLDELALEAGVRSGSGGKAIVVC
jgi:hypothetical protein